MIQTIDIHPVRFNHSIPCGFIDAGYRQAIQHGDITQFQMLIDECENTPQMLNNTVFNTATDWSTYFGTTFSIDTIAGQAIKTTGDIAGITQPIVVADGVLMKIIVDIQITSGAFLLNVGTHLQTISNTGTFTFYVIADGVGAIGFLGGADSSGAINRVELYPVNTNFEIEIGHPDGTTVRTIDTINNPEYFHFSAGFMTVSFDWTQTGGGYLPDGCYELRVSDPCDCGNGGFVAMDFRTVQNQWMTSAGAYQPPSTNGWNFLSGLLTYNGLVTPESSIYYEDVICGGETYEITYSLTGMNAGNEFQIRVGTVLGTNQTTNGTFTETITAAGTSTQNLILYGRDTGGGGSFTISDFSIKRVNRSFDYISNLFDVKSVHNCTCLVSACNDSNALLAGYNATGFSPSIRIAARYGQGGYSSNQNRYESSFGRMNRYYYRGRKVSTFMFSAPMYVHDFFAHLAGYDHVFIDGDEVFMNDDEYPSISWVDNWDLGDVELQVTPKQSLIEKRRCAATVSVCSVDGFDVPISIDGNGNIDDTTLGTETTGEILTDG